MTTTTIRAGARAHAALVAESGAPVGSACRYRGVVQTVSDREITIRTGDGAIRHFPREHVHHEADCPAAIKGDTR